jgi:hypothetical protein
MVQRRSCRLQADKIAVCVNVQDSKREIFDVFLCHNSEDKPAIRVIWQKLAEKGIKPWLDEKEIRPGTSWQTALGQEIESISALQGNTLGPTGFEPTIRQTYSVDFHKRSQSA